MVAEIIVGGLLDGACPESGIEGYEFKDQSGKTTGLNVRSTSQCQTARIKACRRYSCITGLVVVGTRQRLRSGTLDVREGNGTARHAMASSLWSVKPQTGPCSGGGHVLGRKVLLIGRAVRVCVSVERAFVHGFAGFSSRVCQMRLTLGYE